MHQDREIRQESYLATKYGKAQQDVGLFLCYLLINQPLISREIYIFQKIVLILNLILFLIL